jgi:hypothetical protein
MEQSWTHLIDTLDPDCYTITHESLNRWNKDPNKKLYCVYCSQTLPITVKYCTTCHSYKSITPYITSKHRKKGQQNDC